MPIVQAHARTVDTEASGTTAAAAENALEVADDAFGTVVGRDSLGIYNADLVRGFSPTVAQNVRIEGMYFDNQALLSRAVQDRQSIRVGLAAQGQVFPAPSGIVDYHLRSSGLTPSLSATSEIDSRGTYGTEIEAQVPFAASGSGTSLGAALYRTYLPYGGSYRRVELGAVPRWEPVPNVEVVGFYSRIQTFGETALPLTIPSDERLPPRVARDLYPGPGWIGINSLHENWGAIAGAKFRGWSVKASLFHSRFSDDGKAQNTIRLFPDESIDRTVTAFPPAHASSWSEELRASRRIDDGPRSHLLTMTLGARQVDALHGDGVRYDYGITTNGTVIAPPAPDPVTGPLTRNRTRQVVGGLSYALRWQRLGEVILGLQRTDYVKDDLAPLAGAARTVSRAWLPSVAANAHLAATLEAYGSYVEGLEDSAIAPSFAANAGAVLPANLTRQWDGGVRWSPSVKMSLVLGYYSATKPYLSLSQGGSFGVLGSETHRGVEASLVSSPVKGLTIIAGATIGSPRVVADAAIRTAVGPRPIAQSATSAQVNLGYILPFARALALDATLNYDSAMAATLDNKVFIGPATRVSLGARWSFRIGGRHATLRVLAKQLGDLFTWIPVDNGVYRYRDSRSVDAYLTVDL